MLASPYFHRGVDSHRQRSGGANSDSFIILALASLRKLHLGEGERIRM